MKPLKPPQTVDLKQPIDVIAAIEALRFNDSPDIMLVVPPNDPVFRNLFNLSLLKQIATILNKRVTLATTDQTVIKLAQQLDLATTPPFKTPSPETIKAPPPPVVSKVETLKPAPVQAKSAVAPDIPSLSSRRQSTARRVPTPITVPKKRKKVKVKKNLAILFTLGAVFVGGLAGVYFFWPHRATIEIQTDVSTIRASIQADLSTTASAVDEEALILPLQMVPKDHTIKLDVEASGQAEGQKASGVIEVFNCRADEDLVLNDETVFTKNNLDFVLQSQNSTVTISPSTDADDCEAPSLSNKRSLRIEATQAGDEYNLETGSYTIKDLDSQDYNARGFDMEGGQSSASCITDDDLKTAKERFSELRNDSDIQQEMQQTLKADNLIPLPRTFQVAQAAILEPPTCPQITDNQLSQVLVYYLGGVKNEDLDKIVRPELKKKVNELTILDNGLQTAEYQAYIRLGSQQEKPTIQQPADLDYYVIISIDQAQAGIVLDEAEIVQQIKGVPAKQAGSDLRRLEGVRRVNIGLSPFWAGNLPQDEASIILNIDNQDEVNNNL